jgi:hypothetical protein
VLADERVQDPVSAIVKEYGRRTGSEVVVEYAAANAVNRTVKDRAADADVVVCLVDKEEPSTIAELPGATNVAWKHPGSWRSPGCRAPRSSTPAASG